MPLKPMPKQGMSKEALLERLHSLKQGDAKWHGGRMFGLIYDAGPELEELARDVYSIFLFENGLSPIAFPSLLRMENEFIAMAADLMSGDERTAGCMTSGGTESILVAIKSARDWARREKPEVTAPEMVMPVTAHPAWNKAAHFLGLKTVIVPVDEEMRADVRAMEAAITDNTIILGGTAVTYPHGVIDPIDHLGELAESRNLWLHVDGCLGAYMLAFLRKLGQEIPPFDLAVPGVKSMSLDIHKYGFIPKGASTVLYRNEELREFQFTVYTDWPGGVYATPSLSGARPGGPLASAWAIMHFLGEEGFLKLARTTREATVALIEGVKAIPELFILGRPEASVFAFGSEKINIFELGARLNKKGWHIDSQHLPPSLHMTVSPAHAAIVGEFLADLRQTAGEVSRIEPGDLSGEAAMYGMLGTMPDRSMAKQLALKYLSDLYKFK